MPGNSGSRLAGRAPDLLVARLRALAGREVISVRPTAPCTMRRSAVRGIGAGGTTIPSTTTWFLRKVCLRAGGLAGAWTEFFRRIPGANFPLVFEKTLPDGKVVGLQLLADSSPGFPEAGGPIPCSSGFTDPGGWGIRSPSSAGRLPAETFLGSHQSTRRGRGNSTS